MSNTAPKLHNAMWPGLVGKGNKEKGEEPAISLERMLDLTAAANVDGQKFDGIDYFLFLPHTDPNASDDAIKVIADQIASYGFKVGSLVAPVWPGTVGDSAMGNDAQQEKFLDAVRMACHIAKIFNEHGVRQYGALRVDSAEFGIAKWRLNPSVNTKRIINTFQKATEIAEGYGERLVAELEVCWAGMHSCKQMLHVLEGVGKPNSFGMLADLAHVHTAMLGFNSPSNAVIKEGYSEAEFWTAYEQVTDSLRPWTYDFHVAQNDGTVHGTGTHDKTGKHCLPDDPNGKLDIVKCSGYWLKDATKRGIQHICWDGCMFPNAVLETPDTWNSVLSTMIKVRNAHGWN